MQFLVLAFTYVGLLLAFGIPIKHFGVVDGWPEWAKLGLAIGFFYVNFILTAGVGGVFLITMHFLALLIDGAPVKEAWRKAWES